MRIDGIYPTAIMGDQIDKKTGQVEILGYQLNVQTVIDNANGMTVNLKIPIQRLIEAEMDFRKVAEEGIMELLKIDVTEVDRFELEYYKRELENEKAKTTNLENGLMELTLMYTNEVV